MKECCRRFQCCTRFGDGNQQNPERTLLKGFALLGQHHQVVLHPIHVLRIQVIAAEKNLRQSFPMPLGPIFTGIAVIEDLSSQIGASNPAENHRIFLDPYLLPKSLQFLEKFRSIGEVFFYIRKSSKINRFRCPILRKMMLGLSFCPDFPDCLSGLFSPGR